MGDFGDRFGHSRILIVLLIASAVFFIPQALASSLSILLVFRFLFGMVMGGTLPALRPQSASGRRASIQERCSAITSAFVFSEMCSALCSEVRSQAVFPFRSLSTSPPFSFNRRGALMDGGTSAKGYSVKCGLTGADHDFF